METANNSSTETKSPAQKRIIHDRNEVGEILAGLIENATREIVIFSPHLEGTLFNTSRFARALASFVARHRHNLVRIVVEDANQSIRDNDRLVLLFRRLSDFIHMHQVAEEHVGIREMFVVVDHRSYLYQEDISRYECISDLNDAHQAVTLARRFNELWDRSEPIQSLRSAGL